MKIAAYQFNVCGDIQKNMANIEKAIEQAVEKKVELIIFPECALTGYPPRDIKAAKSVDTDKVDREINRLQQLADIILLLVQWHMMASISIGHMLSHQIKHSIGMIRGLSMDGIRIILKKVQRMVFLKLVNSLLVSEYVMK